MLRAQRLVIFQAWEDGHLALRMLRQLLQEMRLDPNISSFDAQGNTNASGATAKSIINHIIYK